MRVIAGDKRRYGLYSPKGNKIRPTSDKIKETLFNMLDPFMYDCVFWDLFAGTGQIGIEALSRGARIAVFFDKDRDAIKLIHDNIAHVGYEEYSVIIPGNVSATLSKASKHSPDIIFMDPPYNDGLYEGVFNAISKLTNLKENVLIIAEAPIEYDFAFLEDTLFFVEKQKEYKSSKHVFVRIKK